MDIVSRLKIFIQYLGIQVTQFADKCAIPRPSMSQLLNGRNKKVSNELIGKIHTAYPELSVLWLMFGQGDMLIDGYKQFSGPQNTSTIDFSSTKTVDNVSTNSLLETEKSGTAFMREKKSEHTFDDLISPISMQQSVDSTSSINTSDTAEQNSVDIISEAIRPVQDRTKTVVNIIVYYSDNSFESFVPGKS